MGVPDDNGRFRYVAHISDEFNEKSHVWVPASQSGYCQKIELDGFDTLVFVKDTRKTAGARALGINGYRKIIVDYSAENYLILMITTRFC